MTTTAPLSPAGPAHGPAPLMTLTATEARGIALRAQGLLGAPDRRSGVRGMLRRLGAVQLDTISVLARSHELVSYARLGPVGRGAVEAAYWGPREARTESPTAFEYWSHAACVLPIEEWPHFAFRRRAYRARPQWNHEMSRSAYDMVIKRLREEGPLTATELGGAKNGGPWWDWSEAKVAVERALMYGEVVCTSRRGWKRVYELAERAVPDQLRHDKLDDHECLRELVRLAGASLGVATRADLADYHRLRLDQVDAVVANSGLMPVAVEGWGGRPTDDRRARGSGAGGGRNAVRGAALAWAHPPALESVPRGRHRTTLLSPFDSLIWDRARTERIFGFQHRLEAYVPKSRRVYGYFAMPLLSGGQLLGRVDPAREGTTLVARHISLEVARAVEPMAVALTEAARWVGCADVRVERVTPANLAGPLNAAVLAASPAG